MSSLDYNYIAELVTLAQTGDKDGFAKFYAATYQRQYQFALRYLKDEYLAQDALQETYILALKNISKLKNPSLAIAWLNQINYRVCNAIHKKQQRFNNEMSEYSDKIIDSLSPSENNNPEAEALRFDLQEYMMKQIHKLPFPESQVIILKYYHNMKHDGIAELMDISHSSVKRYLSRGRKHLKSILQY